MVTEQATREEAIAAPAVKQPNFSWRFANSSKLVLLLLLIFNLKHSPLIAIIGLSLIAYEVTSFLIDRSRNTFIQKGLSGRDMSKPGKPVIAEAMGSVCAAIYILCILCFVPWLFYENFLDIRDGALVRDHETLLSRGFPFSTFGEFLSAALSLQTVVILGIADDILDLKWRHKFFLPSIAAIPLLVIYYVCFGKTTVAVPYFLKPYFGSLIDIGALYYIYMASVIIFCTNSINILAGVNGIEAGQSLVIACFLCFNSLLYVLLSPDHISKNHYMCLYFLIPFCAVTVALLKFNWYPSKVFVGDTFCYFAGMTFGVVGILGHFSKTLLLLFIPQIFNFVLSSPQLFGFVPCPRHRLPCFDETTGKIEASTLEFKSPPSKVTQIILKLLERLKLVKLTYMQKGQIRSSTNLTLLCVILNFMGPMYEYELAWWIIGLQTICCTVGLAVRHCGARLLYSYDNLRILS